MYGEEGKLFSNTNYFFPSSYMVSILNFGIAAMAPWTMSYWPCFATG